MVEISTLAATGKTLVARLQRISDNFFWNNATSAFQAGDDTVALTDGTGVMVGRYTSPTMNGMGDAGQVRVTIHDTGQSNRVIGVATLSVYGGNEADAAGIATAVLFREVVSGDTIPEHCLGEIILMGTESETNVAGTLMTIRKPDGTTLRTRTLTPGDASQPSIRGIS